MCKSKMATNVIEPSAIASTPRSSRSPKSPIFRRSKWSSSAVLRPASKSTTTGTSTAGDFSSSVSSNSSKTSLSSLKDSLPEAFHVYEFSELSTATSSFLAKPFSFSSSSSSWRCCLRSRDVVVFRRKLRSPMKPTDLKKKLSLISRCHHGSIIKLRGASISGNYVYLAYDYVNGVSLFNCLKNPRNPSFTILSSWLSRMQIATDLAHGLEYIHHCAGTNSGFVHNHIKSSGIIVTEPTLNARFCHFGTAELCGEVEQDQKAEGIAEHDESEDQSSLKLRRSGSRGKKFEGTRGYMAPELQYKGVGTRETDVYAFGVVTLELFSGEEPLKYCLDEGSGGYRRVSVIETAREAVRNGGLRSWVDRRLKDSYPVEVAEKMVEVALECLDEEPQRRPDMCLVAGRVSKMYLESKNWAKRMGAVTDFSLSTIAPR